MKLHRLRQLHILAVYHRLDIRILQLLHYQLPLRPRQLHILRVAPVVARSTEHSLILFHTDHFQYHPHPIRVPVDVTVAHLVVHPRYRHRVGIQVQHHLHLVFVVHKMPFECLSSGKCKPTCQQYQQYCNTFHKRYIFTS